jgi:hypothetical protein
MRIDILGSLPYRAPLIGGHLPSERTRQYHIPNIPDITAATLPDEFRLPAMPGTGSDQGRRGTCTAFAAAACAEPSLARNLSEQHLYYLGINERRKHGQTITKDGLPPDEAFSVLENFGIVDEDMWPYVMVFDQGNIDGGPLPAAVNSATKYKISAAYRLDNSKDRSFDSICRRLYTTKAPILISTPVQAEAGWASGPLIDDSPNVRSAEANHCIAVCGFSLPTNSLIFKNSWSALWGVFGFGIMRKTFFDKYASEIWAITI